MAMTIENNLSAALDTLGHTGRQKILIIDDDKMDVDVLEDFLEPQYEVIVATDGVSGFEAAEKNLPDIILLDIIMPGMSGFEVIGKLKNSALTMKIPVIYLTGLDDDEDEEKGLFLGAVDYITKPFNKSIVFARIKNYLQMVEYIHAIEKLCMLDPLTGLLNRRGFNMRMDVEWSRAYRENKNLGIILLDIDTFKDYNDTYGHPQGDLILKTITSVISATLKRATDFLSRWGGEEFIVLLPNTDLAGTVHVAELIRKNVESTIIPYADGEVDTSVTVSLGAFSAVPAAGDTISSFIVEADKLLYEAKKSGRNRTCSAYQS